jgi:Na+-driven multidrug efflux pump
LDDDDLLFEPLDFFFSGVDVVPMDFDFLRVFFEFLPFPALSFSFNNLSNSTADTDLLDAVLFLAAGSDLVPRFIIVGV